MLFPEELRPERSSSQCLSPVLADVELSLCSHADLPMFFNISFPPTCLCWNLPLALGFHKQRTGTALWVWGRGGEMAAEPPVLGTGWRVTDVWRLSYTHLVYRVYLYVVCLWHKLPFPLCSVHRNMEYFALEGTSKVILSRNGGWMLFFQPSRHLTISCVDWK